MGFDNKPTDKTKQKAQESTNDVLKRMSKDYSSVQTTGGGSSSHVVGNPDIINKGGYDAMHKSPEDLEITMAKNQTALELVDRTVSGFTYNAASSFISNFGSFDPNLTYNMMVGQESEYSNLFLDYAGKLQQKGQAQTQKIYKKDPTKIIDFTDPAYWAEQTIQAGTSFGMFAASTLETLALSAILPGGGTAMAIGKNTAKGIVQMQKAKKYKQFLSQTLNYLKKAPTQALTFGVVNRHAESVMEASETFKSLQQEFLDKGYDEEVAKKYAADGAARVYRLNMPLFLIDAAQWTLLTRLSPFKGSSTFIDNMLDKIKNPVLRGATALGMNMISEGAEEGYQHIAQEEGQFFAKSKLSDYNEEIESKGSFTNRMGNYLTDAHFWNAVVAGAYGSLLLAPIGGAGGYINQRRLEKSQKEFNEKLLWGKQTQQLQQLNKSFELEEEGKLTEALVLRQHATNAEALNALEWDATTGKESSWIAYENKYRELINLSKQSDEVIDEAMQKIGFTDANGSNREARINMVKGKEKQFTQLLSDGYLAKNIFEQTTKELGKFGKSNLVTGITAQKLQASQIKQKIEGLKDEANSFAEKIEGLTSVGKIQFNIEAAKKTRDESLVKLKKSLVDGKLSEKEKVGVTSKIQQLESIGTEEVQEAIFNNAIVENKLKDNRTTEQKTQDAEIIKNTLLQHKNNPVAQQEFFKDRLEEIEQLIETNTTDLALKTNYRQAAIEAIKLAENVEELKEVGDELVKDGQMNVALKNKIEEKAVEINNKKLKIPEDKTVGDVLNERHEVHAEIVENEKLTESASSIAVIVEEALEETKPIEEVVETGDKKEEVKSERKLTQPVIVEENWDDLFSNLSMKHDKINNDFVNFSEKHDFLNEEQVDKIAIVLKNLVELGLLSENFTIEEAINKLITNMGISTEMVAPYIIGIAKAMERMNFKIDRPNVYSEIKKITTPPITEAKADAVAIEEADGELVQSEKEDITKAKEETTEEVHYRAEPTFSYLSRKYEVIKEQDENGEIVEKIVEVIDELNQSQIVDYKHLLNPNTNFYESEFVIYIPENAQDLPVSVKTETGTNIKGLTKPFKEFNFEEGSQEWMDNIPIFVGMKNPETGEVIPVAYLHQQNWVTKENLFAEKFDDGTLSETYDEVEKINITKQAQEQNRKVRQAAIDGKGLAVNIEISQVSNGKNFTIAKDAPLRPLKEASLNQSMPIMINKGNIIGLPDGINKDAIKGMAELLNQLGTKVIIAEIRHTGTGAYGDKEYTVYKVLPGKFKADTELLNNMKHSVVNAVKIYLYKDYIKGKKKASKGDAAFATEIEDLKKVNEEMLDDSKVWYELTTSDSLLEYLSNFFIQSDNFGGLKTHNSETIRQEINKSFKGLHGGIPFVKVTKQGQVVMGYVGQEDSYVLLDPKNIDPNIVEEQIEKFLNAVDESVLDEKTSPIIPKNALFYDRNFPISFIIPNEKGSLSRVDTETGYRDFLYENSMYTNVLTENLGTKENPIYVTRFQKVFSFTLAEKQEKSKVVQDSKHINEQHIKEQEKLVENLPVSETVDKSIEDALLENILAEEMLPEETFKTEAVENINTEEDVLEKSLEEKELLSIAKKFTKFLTEQPVTDTDGNITMRGYLELIPIEYQLKIISYIYNQLIAQIDLQNVQQTNLTNLKNNIREIVDSQILAHEASYLKILNALKQIENPSEEVIKSIEDLERFQSYFETIKDEDNYAKLEKQALIEFKNKTNLTETASNINEDGEVLEDVLEENNRQSETLLEQSSLTKVWKPTQEASIFLSGIPKLDAQGNLIRTIFDLPEYYDSKDILEKVRALSTLYLTEPTIDGFIKNLENVLTNNPEYSWLQSFIDRFKVADKKTQTVLVVNLVKDVVIMEFISYNYNSKTKEWSSTVWNTNANDIARLVQDSWEQQFLVTDLINFNGGVATYNKIAIKNVLNKIANLKVTVTNKVKNIVEASKEQNSIVEKIVNRKGFTNITIPDSTGGVSLMNLRQKGALINIAGKTFEVVSVNGIKISLALSEGVKKGGSVLNDIKELFISVGIDIKDSTINHLVQNGLTNTKGVTVNLQGLFAKNGLFYNLEDSLNKLVQSKEDVEVDLDADTFPLNSSGISNLAKLDAKYNLAKLSQSFRDNKKTISTYKDNNLFTQKTIELKNVNGAKRALYKKNAFSKHSLWLKFLDGTGAENALMRDVFQASYLGLTSLKEIGKKAYRDNSLHKLDNSDLEFIYLSAFTDLKAGNLVEGHKINGLETRLARVFSFPMADKDLIFMVKTLVLNIKNQHLEDNFSESLQKILYSQIALPEIERMLNHVKNGEKTNIEGYDKGAMLAIMYPVLNAAIIEHQGEKFTLQNFIRKFSSELENPYSEAFKLLENTLTPKIVDVVKNKIEEKIKVWEDSGIIYKETSTTTVNGEEVETVTLKTKIDSKYLKSLGEDLTLEERIRLTAANFVINQHIASANQMMLYSGDIAQYTKFDPNAKESLQQLEDVNLSEEERIYHSEIISRSIDDNFGKRSALLLAPRSHTEDTVNSKYLQIFLADNVGVSNILPYITKKLDGVAITIEKIIEYQKAVSSGNTAKVKEILSKYPNSKNYFKIVATDAQEYTTLKEHLYNLEKRGELGNLTTQDILEKVEEIMQELKSGTRIENLSSEHKKLMDFILQPMKNVYTGEIWDEQNNLLRSMYIKSSDFPLVPWLTMGTPLDSLRIAMENLETKSGMNVRASYESANKIGGVSNKFNMFDSDGNIVKDIVTAENLEASSMVLERKYHGKQQNVPYKSDKKKYDEVSLGTQESKLLMSLVSGLDGFVYKGETIDGDSLIQKYNETFEKLYEIQYNTLFDSLGVDTVTGKIIQPIKHFKALQKLVSEEATNRGWSLKDKETLTVVAKLGLTSSTGERVIIKLNLTDIEQIEKGEYNLSAFSAEIRKQLSPENFRDTLGNIVVNFEIPAWISGNKQNIESLLNSIVSNRVSKIKMPGASYVLGSPAGFTWSSIETLSEDVKAVVSEGVIYFDNYTGESLKNSHTDENGIFHPAQVLMPSKIRDNKGKLLNLNDPKYYTIVNGKRFIKKEMFSQEVWERISFRIPTSKLSSSSVIEVVGILPLSVGDLIITPKDFTVQKGLDYDVDKEYTYHKYTWVDENGVIQPLSKKYEDLDVSNLTEDELRKTRRDFQKLLNLFAQNTEISDEINQLINLGASEYIELWGLDVKQDKIYEVFEKFEIKYPGKNIDEIFTELKRRLEYQEDISKLLKNDIIDQHLAVLKHSELQKEILEVLSIALAKKDAEYFQSLSSGKKGDYFTMLDATHQISKISNAASSKVGVGAYSLDVVFNGLLQQAYNKTKTEIRLREIFITEDGYPVWIPYTLNIGGMLSSGNISTTNTLDGFRSKAEVLSERQNLMLDDAKESIAWRVNLNTMTMDADKALVFLGFDLLGGHSVAFSLFSQPIIKEYVKIMKRLGAATQDEYVTDKIATALEELTSKFGGLELYDSIDHKEFLSKVTHESFKNGITNPTNMEQLAFLKVFLELDAKGKSLRKIETSLNVDSKGVGISINEVLERKNKLLQILEKDKVVEGVSTLFGSVRHIDTEERVAIEDLKKQGYYSVGTTLTEEGFDEVLVKPDTAPAIATINGLKAAELLWLPHFAQSHAAYQAFKKSVLNEISSKITQEEEIEYNIALEEDLLEAYQKFHNSDTETGMFPEDVDNLRRTFIRDTVNTIALGTYLQKLKIGEQKELFENNAFLKALRFRTDKQGKVLIEFNSSARVNIDERVIHEAIAILYNSTTKLPSYNGREYSTRELVKDLRTFAYLQGGIQEAVEFIKFLPTELIAKTNYIIHMNKLNIQLKGYSRNNYVDVFKTDVLVKQFFQHFPNRAAKITVKEIEENEANIHIDTETGELKPFKLNIKNLESFAFSYGPKYLTLYDNKSETKYALFEYDFEMAQYVKIPTYTSFGMSQYNKQRPLEENIDSINSVNELESLILKLKESKVNYVKNLNHVVLKDGENSVSFNIVKNSISEDSNPFKIGNSPANVLNAKGILERVSNSENLSEFEKDLAKLLSQALAGKPIEIIIFEDTVNIDGLHSKQTPTALTSLVGFNEAIFGYSEQEQARIILHEFIHATLVQELSKFLSADGKWLLKTPPSNQMQIAIYQIGKLYQQYNKISQESLNTSNKRSVNSATLAVKNVHEFIAEIMTSQEFQKNLSEKTVPKTEKSFMQKFNELVTKFLNALNKSLNFEVKKDSITAEAVSNIITILEGGLNTKKLTTPIDYLINQHVQTPIVTEEITQDFDDAMSDYFADENNIVYSLPEKHTNIKEGVSELFEPEKKSNPININAKFPKDQIKADYADGIIGHGTHSTGKYANAFGGTRSNFNKGETIMISVNGNNRPNQKENVEKTKKDIDKAINQGVVAFIADNENVANSSHNSGGEGVIRDYLLSKGLIYKPFKNVGLYVVNRANVSNIENSEAVETTKIAEGVSELFESNQTFANAVYESLGLNTINESEITYTDEEGNPCAKMGLTNTTKGTDWKIVKDFKGKPKHSQGGVDITISDKGVTMRRGGKDIKAKYGLLLLNAEDGSLIPDDKKKEAPIFQGGTLPVTDITAKAPTYIKYKQEWEKENPFDLNKYIEDRFNNPVGREAIKKIDGKSWREELRKEGLQKRYNSAMDYVGEQLVKNKPQGKLSRAEWLNQMSDKEEEIIKRNPKYQSSLWADTKRGLTSLVEQNSLQTFQNILTSSDYSNREKREMLKDYVDHPIMSKLGDAAKILNPLTVPSKMVQSAYKDDYSFTDALKGKKNDAGIVEDIVTDPLNLVGVGLVGKLSKADKVIDATKVGSKVLNKTDDIAKPITSYVDDVGSLFKGTLTDKEKEMYRWFEKQQKLNALPKTTNKKTLGVLEDFKTRIQTPEGKKRMKELGIDSDEMLQKIQIVEDPNTFGYFSGDRNRAVLNPLDPLPTQTARHEIEHGVQSAFQKQAIKNEGKIIPTFKKLFTDPLLKKPLPKSITDANTKIDDLLSGLELRKQGTPNKQWRGHVERDSPVDISEYKSLISNRQNATDYFLTGSEGREKSAFLGEVQQYMMNNNIIPKTSYTEVTPEMVKNTFINAMFDETGGGKYLRLFNIMKPSEANYKLISEGLNKMLGLIPPAIGIGAAIQSQNQNKSEQ